VVRNYGFVIKEPDEKLVTKRRRAEKEETSSKDGRRRVSKNASNRTKRLFWIFERMDSLRCLDVRI